ncbi:MAG: class I SAM-dependent methyltransferase, partial [Firmicutes bacterium]|nr:class I SAM-dependent methyltransferase [Bacillota bacterium]
VHAFDIQEKAVEMTSDKLRAEGLHNVSLHRDSFVNMDQHVAEGSAAAVVFNLGYLPGGDHSITTVGETTLSGLEKALKVLKPGGVITVVLYDGHEEGRAEKEAVLSWAKALDARSYHAAFVNFINQENFPPEILWVTKK